YTSGLHREERRPGRRCPMQPPEDREQDAQRRRMDALGVKEPHGGALSPKMFARIGERLADHSLLQVSELAGRNVRLLFDRRQQKRVELRVFFFDLMGDFPMVELVFGVAPPQDKRGHGDCQDQYRENKRKRPAGDQARQEESDSNQRYSRPAPRQSAPQSPAPIIARDRFEMRFEEAVYHADA